jgi:hypothetical protein
MSEVKNSGVPPTCLEGNAPKELAVEVWERIRSDMNERDQNRFIATLSLYITNDRRNKIEETDARLKYLIGTREELEGIVSFEPTNKVPAYDK